MSSTVFRNKKAEAIAKAKEIYNAATEGELSEEQTTQFDNLMIEAEKFGVQAEKLERLEKLEAAQEAESKMSRGRVTSPAAIEPTHKDIKRYSVLKAIRQTFDGRLDGLEKEVSDEIANRYGKKPQGFYMPLDLPVHKFTAANATTGAGAVETIKDFSNFIDVLRSKMVMQQVGARVLSDLSGNLSVPKMTGGGTAYWINGDGSSTLTESSHTIGAVTLSPSTLGAFTILARNLISQTSADVEALLRNDLASVLAHELDRVAINGSGSGAEPEGLLQSSSVTSVALGANGAAPTYAALVALETAVAHANADFGTLAYITSPKGRGKMKVTVKESGHPVYLWENGNIVNGYNAVATTSVPSNLSKASGSNLSAVLFGNFADTLYGLWGGVDVLVDPYTGGTAGSVKIICMQDCDVQFRNYESFAKITDMIVA